MSARVRRLALPQIDPRLDIVVSDAAECIASLGILTNADVRRGVRFRLPGVVVEIRRYSAPRSVSRSSW